MNLQQDLLDFLEDFERFASKRKKENHIKHNATRIK